ncbi:type III secretion system inner membrane ring lipoprotein SctJ [Pantoea cypripedii]|jgi:type III secretion system inner membrane ring protein|uniref:Lipoprotein n=1 Tax=Pantoea cypripedii TaxID=55209 RepID=A0A6B9G3Y2_PANCY|nr:type III secretion inner membrane ring lipoprotein SctJ [Pantoea cypripedii]QGY32204.1 EscJ/YscJ/HrcJ family type III secretion inner membrane ring protein [Pantoea cypripedii]
MKLLTTGKKCLFILLMLLLTACQDEVLTGLSERQANEVIALLERYHIPATKSHGEKKQFNVRVDQKNMKQAISLIADYRLPSQDDVEIDRFFPTDALVASPRAEKARLISAIEQKLQQSLLRLDEAVEVRVHISYPLEDESRLANPPDKRISVLMLHRPLDDATIFANKIRLFILNSFPDVKLENITVVLFAKQEPQPYSATIQPADPSVRGPLIMASSGLLLATLLLIFIGVRLYKRRTSDASRKS